VTGTASFGTSKREGHDASIFYARELGAEPVLSTDTTVNKTDIVDQIWCADARTITDRVAENSVGLVFTSPPYHVGKDYDTDQSFDDYLAMLFDVLAECYVVLEPGGKCVINVAGLGRKPYVPLQFFIYQIAAELGFLARGEIIWVKGRGSSGSCAWGTFKSAKNPVIRDLHEYLLVFSKGRWGRVRDGESDIAADVFMENTLSVWEVRPESAKRVGHPAPFPEELAERVILLFSYVDDLVLDPFLGSGTTAIAAERHGRHWVGFESNMRYALLADQRIRGAR